MTTFFQEHQYQANTWRSLRLLNKLKKEKGSATEGGGKTTSHRLPRAEWLAQQTYCNCREKGHIRPNCPCKDEEIDDETASATAPKKKVAKLILKKNR